MSFQKTSLPNSIRLDDGYILIAAVQTADKAFYMDASIDLNTCLGNINGVFAWGETNFSATALEATITVLANPEEAIFLEARLQKEDGEYITGRIDLNEKIENQNGKLVYNPDYSTSC